MIVNRENFIFISRPNINFQINGKPIFCHAIFLCKTTSSFTLNIAMTCPLHQCQGHFNQYQGNFYPIVGQFFPISRSFFTLYQGHFPYIKLIFPDSFSISNSYYSVSRYFLPNIKVISPYIKLIFPMSRSFHWILSPFPRIISSPFLGYYLPLS